MENKKFTFEVFVRQASEQLKDGKPSTGSDGGFAPPAIASLRSFHGGTGYSTANGWTQVWMADGQNGSAHQSL